MQDAHSRTTVPRGGKTTGGSAVADDAPEDPWVWEAIRRSMGRYEKPIKTKDCRRGEKCADALCGFVHPGEAKLPAPTRTITNRPVKSGKKCRFGDGCYNSNCRFDHPLTGGELPIHQAPLASQAPHPPPNPSVEDLRQLVKECDQDIQTILGPPTAPPRKVTDSLTHVGTLAGEKEAAPTHGRRILPEREEEGGLSFADLLARVQEDTEEEKDGTFLPLASLLRCDACVEEEDPSPPSAPHSAHSEEEEEPPEDFFCPITQELMRDPVTLADGHTYDRTAIEKWLRRYKTSPKTGLPLDDHSIVIPNHLIRSMIDDWKQKKRAHRPA
jgi:hypothetical protein